MTVSLRGTRETPAQRRDFQPGGAHGTGAMTFRRHRRRMAATRFLTNSVRRGCAELGMNDVTTCRFRSAGQASSHRSVSRKIGASHAATRVTAAVAGT